MRILRLLGVTLGFAAAALPMRASAQPLAPPDSATYVVFEYGTPVGNERSAFQNYGDSIVVSSETKRQFLDEKGGRHQYSKTMVLVVDARDLGLLRYVSGQRLDGSTITRGLIPGDTAMTYYRELDGAGSADRVVQPPGRLFVMDSQMFALFDVLCRSLVGKRFTTRRVQMLALQPDSLATPLATVTAAAEDTLQLGRLRITARHYTLEDPSARFDLWADRQGRLLRLTHDPSGLRVERVPDQVVAPAAARKRTPMRAKTSAPPRRPAHGAGG